MIFKVCTKCKQKKLVEGFYRDKYTKDGLTNWCKKCRKEYSQSDKGKAVIKRSNQSKKGRIRQKRYTQTEKGRAAIKRWQQSENGKRKSRSFNLKQYGLTLEDYDQMLAKQNGRCTICDRHHTNFKWGLVVHHNHETGEVYGLLCRNCNTGLGMFFDSIEVLRNAITYLEE